MYLNSILFHQLWQYQVLRMESIKNDGFPQPFTGTNSMMIFHLWRIYRSCVAGCGQSLVPRCWCWSCWSSEDKKKRGFWVSNGSFGRPAAAGPMGTTEQGRRSNVINLFWLTSGEKCFPRFGKCLAENHIRLVFSWRCLSSQGFTSWRRTRRPCSCWVLPFFGGKTLRGAVGFAQAEPMVDFLLDAFRTFTPRI